MKNLQDIIKDYLTFCRSQKRLDSKTLKAYSIDLKQFAAFLTPNYVNNVLLINREVLENFIAFLHNSYKPKTVKRKLASLKAFFHFLEYRDFIEINPFNKMQIRFREPLLLPKTIPLHTIFKYLLILERNNLSISSPNSTDNSLLSHKNYTPSVYFFLHFSSVQVYDYFNHLSNQMST